MEDNCYLASIARYDQNIRWNDLLSSTSKEHLTSSTVGHIMRGCPRPRGVLSSEKPDDIEEVSSASHFSSKEPREENCSDTVQSEKFLKNG